MPENKKNLSKEEKIENGIKELDSSVLADEEILNVAGGTCDENMDAWQGDLPGDGSCG